MDMDKIVAAILDNPSATVAAGSALLAFVGGVLGPLVQLRIGKRQAAAAQRSADAAMLAAQTAGSRAIATMRLQWMETVRNTMSEYHSILMSKADEELTAAEDQRLSQLGTQLDLLLNRDDALQRELWEVSDTIYNLNAKAERQALDGDHMRAGRAVLKAEWEKVKREMRGGQFETGAAR